MNNHLRLKAALVSVLLLAALLLVWQTATHTPPSRPT